MPVVKVKVLVAEFQVHTDAVSTGVVTGQVTAPTEKPDGRITISVPFAAFVKATWFLKTTTQLVVALGTEEAGVIVSVVIVVKVDVVYVKPVKIWSTRSVWAESLYVLMMSGLEVPEAAVVAMTLNWTNRLAGTTPRFVKTRLLPVIVHTACWVVLRSKIPDRR